MFSQTDTDVLPRRDEGSDKPSATIEPHRIMVPTQTRTQAAGLKVRCRYHYTTAAHKYATGGTLDGPCFLPLSFMSTTDFAPACLLTSAPFSALLRSLQQLE